LEHKTPESNKSVFSLSPEALYRQAQLDTKMRVEGLVEQELSVEAWQALKQKTAD